MKTSVSSLPESLITFTSKNSISLHDHFDVNFIVLGALLRYSMKFMDRLERQLMSQAEIKPHTWWRFIDDIFIIWTEGEDSLKSFIEYLNNAHRTIKFTSKWSCSEIEFLDVKVINDSGRLETDVFIKPRDSHQYLHKTSCHPNACKKGIPFAQALRLRRICSRNSFFEKRASDLCKFLEERGYKKKYVEE